MLGPKDRYLNDADEPVQERILQSLSELHKISYERHLRLSEMQKPGWKEECMKRSMQAIGLLDESSMPYITGHRRETMIERRDRIIREGEEKLEGITEIVKKLNTAENNKSLILQLKKELLKEYALMTDPGAKNELFIIDKDNPDKSRIISRDDFDFLDSRTA